MYEGYRVKIKDTIIPNMLVSAGTYSFVKKKRLVRNWTDANGREHFDYYPTPKVTIRFSLRERTLEEHTSISPILTEQENLSVTYWDDYDCVYKTGNFKMNEPSVKHKKAMNTEIFYEKTEILLEEY